MQMHIHKGLNKCKFYIHRNLVCKTTIFIIIIANYNKRNNQEPHPFLLLILTYIQVPYISFSFINIIISHWIHIQIISFRSQIPSTTPDMYPYHFHFHDIFLFPLLVSLGAYRDLRYTWIYKIFLLQFTNRSHTPSGNGRHNYKSSQYSIR